VVRPRLFLYQFYRHLLSLRGGGEKEGGGGGGQKEQKDQKEQKC